MPELDSDMLLCIFSLVSIRDACSLSQINREAHESFRDYRRIRPITPTRYRYIQRILMLWKSSLSSHRNNVNSWSKRPKDPEQAILLF